MVGFDSVRLVKARSGRVELRYFTRVMLGWIRLKTLSVKYFAFEMVLVLFPCIVYISVASSVLLTCHGHRLSNLRRRKYVLRHVLVSV